MQRSVSCCSASAELTAAGAPQGARLHASSDKALEGRQGASKDRVIAGRTPAERQEALPPWIYPLYTYEVLLPFASVGTKDGEEQETQNSAAVVRQLAADSALTKKRTDNLVPRATADCKM